MFSLIKSLKIKGKTNTNYIVCHWLYGRCLGFLAFTAFISYWLQADALIGHNGLSPWEKDLLNIKRLCTDRPELTEWILKPTLLWIEPFANHHLLFVIGSAFALFLSIGILPALSGAISYLCYLSLMVVGEPFLSFQWDALLCEALFLSIPYLPFSKFHKIGVSYDISPFARYLVIGLLAKLMFESGIVKFTSFGTEGANTWRDLTALDYHYWTQPLPHALSPLIDGLPSWFDRMSLLFMYGTELVLPLFLFLPTMFRRIGLLGQIMLQIFILISGNYGFFNLLTLCLCIPLIDDKMIPRFFAKHCNSETNISNGQLFEGEFKPFQRTISSLYLSLASLFFGITTYGHLCRDLRGNQKEPLIDLDTKWTETYSNMVRPTHAFNSYGLFRVMTTTRPEIIIEGSLDRETWIPYEFRWKPTDPNQSPRFAGPHMPRIDWQMWFEGLSYDRYANHPFSRMLYHKFINTIALGESIEKFNDFSEVIGQQEYQNFIQAPQHVRQQVLANYNSLLHAFHSRSMWFGKLLEAIFEHRPVIMEQLKEKIDALPPKPNYLRVSLAYYTFAEPDDEQVWNVLPVDGASIVISKKDLVK